MPIQYYCKILRLHGCFVCPTAVFLFGILGMGARPSELEKSAREIWKLGKVEMCLKP